MPTPDEILELKAQWVADPCWDIEDTEGFEAHRDELITFAKQHEARLEAEAEARLGAKAERLGCPGNLSLARYVEGLEYRLETLERKISN